MLHIQASWSLVSVKVAILSEWCVAIACFLLKLLLVQVVGVVLFNMTVMLLTWPWWGERLILVLHIISIHSLARSSCASWHTSVVIHATDVSSAALEHVHCPYWLYRPLVSIDSRSFWTFHSQIRNLWKQSWLRANIISSLSLVIHQAHLSSAVQALILIFHWSRMLRGRADAVVAGGCWWHWTNSINSNFQILRENHLVLASAIRSCWDSAVILLLGRLMC